MTEEVTQSPEVTEEGQTQPVEVPDILAMSDDEILNFDPDQFEEVEVEDTSEEEVVEGEDEDPSTEEETTEEEDDSDEDPETEEGDTEESEEAVEETKEESGDSQLTELLAPFKANGREMKVDSVDEARQLMQMGANYNKKMAAMKPNIRMMKMLENNNLLNEESLNYLIDLHNRNPEAIAKLVKDSGIDPLDIDEAKGEQYKPNDHRVSDNVVELDEVINRVSDTPTGSSTLDIVGNKWDKQSQQVLAQNPAAIELINEQVSSGIYELVSVEVEKRRMLGQLTGVSDLNAYQSVGQELTQAGKLNHLINPQQVEKPANEETPKPKVDKVQEKVRKQRKRAASPTKSVGTKTKSYDFNPLELSDEEFSKLNPKFI